MKSRLPRAAVPPLRAAGTALALILVIGVVVRFTGLVDRYLIYFPQREVTMTPADRGVDFEDVFFTTTDGLRLNGWFVPGPDDTTLVWFHGNAGNIGHRVDNLAELHHRLGVSIFIIDYRGYGRSEGSPSERGTYLDAEAALTYLATREDVDTDKLVMFGRSLGCAIAAEAALRSPPQALVLESGFTSIQDMAMRNYPLIGVFGRLVQTKYDCLAKLSDVRVPVLVMHGDRDDVVPLQIGRRLFEAANPPKRFYAIEGAGHNDTYLVGGDAYYKVLSSFLEDSQAGAP